MSPRSSRERYNKRTYVPVRSGADRFGYRPQPDDVGNVFAMREQGKSDRQKVLDKVQQQRNREKWKRLRAGRNREAWESFGNKELPIENHREDIMHMVENNRISLLAGETGSGKSTQLAQYALEMGYDRIVYLQPRRVTADGIGDRLNEELTTQFEERGIEKPEHLVGIAHSGRSTVHEDSIIQVMTSAVFTRRATELREKWCDERVLIVADEIHEANIETEFAVATAAELMTERKDWNMVLMSATLNEDEIQNAYRSINKKPIPSVSVEGRPHTVDSYECPDKTVIDVFDEQCFESGNKTIIFTEGKRSIKDIAKVLEAKYGDRVRVLPLHSKIDERTRQAIFHEADVEGTHTVIVSTSAGQSGLTIPGVDRVISDGWTKSPELDAENAEGLPRRLCSRAELTQQRGRCGRDIEGGKFFLAVPLEKSIGRHAFVREELYPEHSPHRLDHTPPDIYHTVISRNVLSAAAMHRDFYTLNGYLIHGVKKATISDAYEVLRMMGAVDERGVITDIGAKMDTYPLRPELSRAVAEVCRRGTKTEMYQLAAIAAAIEAGGLGCDEIKERNTRVSPETRDDFIKELDLFVTTFRGQPSVDNSQVVEQDEGSELKGIDYINAERAWKQYEKICQRIGLDAYAEESLTNALELGGDEKIYECFLTGMPHLLYEEVRRDANRGRRKRDKNGEKRENQPFVWYRNLLGPDKSEEYKYDRQISKKSLLGRFAIDKSDIIAGYPRWYEQEDGKIANVIEIGFPVKRETVVRILGRAALNARDTVGIGPDGKLYARRDRTVGRLHVSSEVTAKKVSRNEEAELLIRVVTDRPGPALRSLRQVKAIVQDLAERVPKNQRSYFFEKPILTDEKINEIVRSAARNAGGTGELDANIRTAMAIGDIREEAFINEENRDEIERSMPKDIVIQGVLTRVHYTVLDDTPVVYEFPLSAAVGLPDTVKIPDGREIAFRYDYGSDDEGNRDIRYLTAREVREMASV